MMMNRHGAAVLRTMAARCARGCRHLQPRSHCVYPSRHRPWNGATRLVSNYDRKWGDDDIDQPLDDDHVSRPAKHGDEDDGATIGDVNPGSLSVSGPSTEWLPPPQMNLVDSNNESDFVASTEWIPPPRPHSSADSQVKGGGGDSTSMTYDSLGTDDARDGLYGLLATPEQSRELRLRGVSNLPVKRHTLLSRDEIGLCLRESGGQDVVVILDDPRRPRMGGATGMVLATAASLHQLRSMADELVGQLRRRKLHEVGVVGAQLGPEGSLRDEGESWFVVDCRNYVVHLMDETTRRCLNLEALWSGRDGLHRLNVLDEDAVDAYVSDNPVPDEYGRGSLDMDDTLRMLEKIRWSAVPRQDATATRPRARKRRGRRG